jgi:lipopolysaccharide export system protein LptC
MSGLAPAGGAEDPGAGDLAGLAGERVRSIRYSLFVARARFAMPIVAGAIILLVGAWPSLTSGLDRLARHARLDMGQLRDLRMLHPRYTGIDKDGRPFSLTAEAAREQGVNTGTADSLVALDAPRADILTKEGAWIVASGKTGIYQPQTHFLDLSGDVVMFHDKGYRLTTATARVDLDAGSAEGRDPISGGGPSGTIKGEGFRVLQKGDVLQVTGHAELVMAGAHGDDK